VSFVRYLADEDLRRQIVTATRRVEPAIDFLMIQDEGLSGMNDADILEFAFANGRIIVSHDVNTMKAAAEECLARGGGMAGLFLVPQSRSTRAVAESLALVWEASQAEEWEGRIVYLPF
jgi:hypothetical protein